MANRRELLNEKEAAEHIGMSVAYLRADRCRGSLEGRTPGPPWLKTGRKVQYDRADLDAWLDSRRVDRSARRPSRAA